MRDLKLRLESTERKLTWAELERAMAELRLLTSKSEQVAALQAALDKAQGELAEKHAEIFELRAGTGRRDEQIAFLMQVHDATQSCEWIEVEPWTCSACTLSNAPSKTRCDACDRPKPR